MIIVNKNQIVYRKEMTVEDALKEAGEKVEAMDLVTVNGLVIPKDDLSKTKLTDKSIIKVLSLRSGG